MKTHRDIINEGDLVVVELISDTSCAARDHVIIPVKTRIRVRVSRGWKIPTLTPTLDVPSTKPWGYGLPLPITSPLVIGNCSHDHDQKWCSSI